MLDGMYGNAIVFLTKLKHGKVHRFSDQDIMMHYHWGLGVGHHYTHGSVPSSTSCCEHESDNVDLDPGEGSGEEQHVHDAHGDNYDSDHPEFSLRDHETEGWEDVQSDDSDSGDSYGNDSASDVEDLD
jgi:hypothetical protein